MGDQELNVIDNVPKHVDSNSHADEGDPVPVHLRGAIDEEEQEDAPGGDQPVAVEEHDEEADAMPVHLRGVTNEDFPDAGDKPSARETHDDPQYTNNRDEKDVLNEFDDAQHVANEDTGN